MAPADVYQFPTKGEATSSTLTDELTAPRVEVRRCQDFDALNLIARHPQVYDSMADDASPPPHEFHLNEESLYLGVYTPSLVGFWEARPQSTDVFDLHSCLLSEARGQVATFAIPQALRFLFTRTSALTLVGRVPIIHPAARKLATWAGFRPAFITPGGWVKDGQHDLETLYLPLLDWFFRLTSGDVHTRARVLVSTLAVHAQFAKAAYLHSLLTQLVGEFQGDR